MGAEELGGGGGGDEGGGQRWGWSWRAEVGDDWGGGGFKIS